MMEIIAGGRYQEGNIYKVTVWDIAGSTIDFYVTSEGLYYLKGWMDFNGDGFIDVAIDTTKQYFLNRDSVSTVKVERIE